MKKDTTMTSGIIWKEIVVFSIPLILGNLFQQLYNTVDSIIVGNVVGPEALAAVGSSGAIINLLVGFCVGASAGAGVVTSQYYGAKHSEGMRKTVHTTLAIAICAGFILSVLGVLAAPGILRLMDTPEAVFDQAALYLRVFFSGILFSVIYNMSAGILNAVGNSKRSLLYLVIAAITNIILDILFVAVLGMGVAGAALATVISQAVSCVFIIRFMMKSTDLYKVNLREIRFYDKLLSKVIKLGLPAGIQNIVISLSNVVVQSGINSFGATAMAAYAAYNKIDGFNILPILSMSMAATTFAGQNLGAGEHQRIRKSMKITVGMGVAYSLVTATLLLIFAPQIISVFTKDAQVVEYGTYMMKYLYPFYWILAILHITSGTIRGVGKTLEAMVISIVSLCVARIVWIQVAFHVDHRMDWLLLSYPATWLLGAMLILVYVWKSKWLSKAIKVGE